MSGLEHKVPPPVVGAIAAAAMWGIASLGPPLPMPSAFLVPIGGALALAGVAFDVLGLVAFRASRTTVNPLKPESASTLVTGGVYRVTRNPMYTGIALLLLAWAVYLGAVVPFAGPVVFVLYITRFQIQPEERALQRIFGEEYSGYCSRVRRWL